MGRVVMQSRAREMMRCLIVAVLVLLVTIAMGTVELGTDGEGRSVECGRG